MATSLPGFPRPNPQHLYRLGRVLQKHGKMNRALDMFEKAQTFGYDAAEWIAAIRTEMENEKGEGKEYAHL